MWYSDDLIVKRVSRQVRERTRENMEIYNMSLSDAFKEAARNYAKQGTDLYLAWYASDLREYIPSAYQKEYLDFEKYPLSYTPSGKVQLDLQTVHSMTTRLLSVPVLWLGGVFCKRACFRAGSYEVPLRW